MSSALIVALRLLWPQVIADLYDAERAADSARRIQAMRGAAMRLEQEQAERIGRIASWLNERTIGCLELAGQVDLPTEGTQAWALVGKEELDTRIAAAQLARLVQHESREFYHSYAGRIGTLTQRSWPLDELMPLGASALAMAAFTALADLGDDEAVREVVRRTVRTRAPVPLAGVLRDAEAQLALHGVPPLPDDSEGPPRIIDPSVPQDDGPPEVPVSGQPVHDSVAAPPVAVEAETVEPASAPAPKSEEEPEPAPELTSEVEPTPTSEPAPEVDPQLALEPGPEEPAGDPASVEAVVPPASTQTPPMVMTSAQWTAVDALERSVQGFQQDVVSVRRLGTSPLAGGEPNRLGIVPTLQKLDDIDRDAVAFAHAAGQIPYSREARHALFDKVRGRMREAGVAPAQIAELDVVVAMFDYVIDERRLPASARPLVWRLQQPVMALSLLDPGYLADDPRSLRRLVENFGAIAVGYSDDMVKDGELYRRLETVVRAMEIVASGLQVRSAVIARQVEREYRRASNSVSKLVNRVVSERSSLEAVPGRRNRRDLSRRPGRDREREVTERVRQLLNERVSTTGTPDSVNEFLQSVWLRHLRTTILRDGEDSPPFQRSLGVVDDLLWTLDPGGKSHSRSELAHRIPSLIKLLNVGIRDVDAKDGEYKAFFDELFLIHLQRMRHRNGSRRRQAGADAGLATAMTTSGILLPAETALSGAVIDVSAVTGDDRTTGEELPPADRPRSARPKSPVIAPSVIAPVFEQPAAATSARDAQAESATRQDDAPARTPSDEGPNADTGRLTDSPMGDSLAIYSSPADWQPSTTPGSGEADAAELWSEGDDSPTKHPLSEDDRRGERRLADSFDELLDAPHTFADSSASTTRAGDVDASKERSIPPHLRGAALPPHLRVEPSLDLDDLVPDPLPADAWPTPPVPAMPIVVSPALPSGGVPGTPGPATEERPGGAESPDHRLLEVLNSLDLSDAPVVSARVDLSPEQAVASLQRGTWIEIRSNDGQLSEAKVAWINPRRTVVLLVRHPDRKALSLRMSELRTRFDRGRAYLLR